VHPAVLLALRSIRLGLGMGRIGSAGSFQWAPVEQLRRKPTRRRHTSFGRRAHQGSPDSPLRRKLAVEAVPGNASQRTLVLPAVVEADPARLVKILPPLTGRVIKAHGATGRTGGSRTTASRFRVARPCAAYADYDRAKVLMALALKNRDRIRALAKIGGAEKDLQQAETDYNHRRAESLAPSQRFGQIGVDPDMANKSRTVTLAAPISGASPTLRRRLVPTGTITPLP